MCVSRSNLHCVHWAESLAESKLPKCFTVMQKKSHDWFKTLFYSVTQSELSSFYETEQEKTYN